MFKIFYDIFILFIIFNVILILTGLFFKLSVANLKMVRNLYIKFYMLLLFIFFLFLAMIIICKLHAYKYFFFYTAYAVNSFFILVIFYFILIFIYFFFFIKYVYIKFLPFFICLAFILFSNIFYIFVEDFFSLYIVLEFHTLLMYILYNITLPSYSNFYIKNGIKFFILSVFTSLFLLLGLFFLYFASGTIVFYEIDIIFNKNYDLISVLGLNLVYAVFCFKLGLFPFYIWMLEVFGYLNNIFFLVYVFIAKIPVFITMMKLIFFFGLTHFLYAVSFLSIIYGTFCVLVENDFRFFIIYSSMVQFGGLFLAMVDYNLYIFYGVIYTYINYILVFTLLFFVLLLVSQGYNFDLNVFTSLKYKSILLTASLLILVFSVIGVPPTLGFIGKFNLYYGLLLNNYFYLVLFLIFSSLFSSVYYFNIIRLLYFTSVRDVHVYAYNVPKSILFYSSCVGIFILLFFFF